LVGGKLYAYTAGTSTPKDTYTSYTLGTANTNPVILDARGEADVWLNGSYKLTLKDSIDVQIWSVDDVRDLTSSQTFASPTVSGTAVFTGSAVTWSGNPTHSGNHTWSGNHLFNGNVTVGDAGADSFTVTPNAVTWTNNPTHSGAHTWSGAQTLSSTLTCNGAASFPLVVSTHTFGIKVGNTARSDASTLDYYEEGNWTPGITFGGAAVGVTYNINRKGYYVRIGKAVYVQIRMKLTSKGSSTGTFKITGLPYAASSTDTAESAMVVHGTGFTGLTGSVVANPLTGATTVGIVQWGATGTGTQLTDTSVTDTLDMYITGAYFAD
jgi:hypothetical protein